ncbi:MAG: hypothetical protein LBH96_02400 [Candidatus Peribacteria bacterium]|jgi:hypothetical protein|nr:hypothetical protein [Candidatus Peribacteria bacterium]
MKQFLSRFSNKGFDDLGKEKLVKTLRTIKKLKETKKDATGKSINEIEIQNILNYMIV